MPSTRDIRRRIRSIKNTSQITKAMQMVASSKMARAQQSALNGRPFATMAIDLMSRLAAVLGPVAVSAAVYFAVIRLAAPAELRLLSGEGEEAEERGV